MATPDGNIETLKWAYRLWEETRGGSVEGWCAIVSEDFVVRSVTDQYRAATFGAVSPGKAGFRRYIKDMTENWQMELYDVQRYVGQGADVAVLIETAWRNRTTNRFIATPVANFWTFNPEGRATSLLEIFDTEALIAATKMDVD